VIPVATVPGPGTEQKTLPLELDGRELWLSISGVEFADGTVYAFRSLTEERALEALKGEFVATVSHELRTPLAAIYGSAETLRSRKLDLDDKTQLRLLDVIASEAERLTRVASDILLANQLDTSQLKVANEEVDPVGLAEEVIAELRDSIGEDGAAPIGLVAEERLRPIVSDGDKLRQVLINLIDNAVKYSPRGRPIEVRVETDVGRLRYEVRDQGLGIPQGEQRRIFGKFYRVDPELTTGVGGTGLGLYIARELVRRMGGHISVESRVGEGSTFVVDIPASPIRVPA
jgi:signal transduction histidine kinase